MKQLLPLLLAALASCNRPQPDPVRAAVAAAVAQAKHDSTAAARLDTAAQHYHRLGDLAADSATYYHSLQHVQAQHTPVDSATFQRFFADY